jgi:hypothetical protein
VLLGGGEHQEAGPGERKVTGGGVAFRGKCCSWLSGHDEVNSFAHMLTMHDHLFPLRPKDPANLTLKPLNHKPKQIFLPFSCFCQVFCHSDKKLTSRGADAQRVLAESSEHLSRSWRVGGVSHQESASVSTSREPLAT